MPTQLPDATAIRTMIADVTDHAVDGIVVTSPSPKGPVAETAKDVLSGNLPRNGRECASSANWLMHQLMCATFPIGKMNNVALARREMEFSSSMYRYYRESPCRVGAVNPAHVDWAVKIFAQGDEALAGELRGALSAAPAMSREAFCERYLSDAIPVSLPLGSEIQEPYAQQLKRAVEESGNHKPWASKTRKPSERSLS